MSSSELLPLQLSPEVVENLRGMLTLPTETISFSAQPKVAALVCSLGIQRELGTINDEMARFVFDADTGTVVDRTAIRSELVSYRELVGVRMWVEGVSRIDLRVRGLRAFLHPAFSFHSDGSIASCVFFPELIAKIIAAEGVELVLVNRWGLNTIFGGFDPSQHYYQTNFWELENNDTLLFSKLLEQRRLPFLGTHDLIAHVAGVRSNAWGRLSGEASHVRQVLEDYFREVRTPTIASLVLPYTAGVVLDDLAQPPNYGAQSQQTVLSEVVTAIEQRSIRPEIPMKLMKFPAGFQQVIELARDASLGQVPAEARGKVKSLVEELLSSSVYFSPVRRTYPWLPPAPGR